MGMEVRVHPVLGGTPNANFHPLPPTFEVNVKGLVASTDHLVPSWPLISTSQGGGRG